MTKIQISKLNHSVHLDLEFGIYLGFVICDLGFETLRRNPGGTE